jgi:hypothetical protein
MISMRAARRRWCSKQLKGGDRGSQLCPIGSLGLAAEALRRSDSQTSKIAWFLQGLKSVSQPEATRKLWSFESRVVEVASSGSLLHWERGASEQP